MDTENLQIQIKTFFGLEEILAEEIKKLGGRKVKLKTALLIAKATLVFSTKSTILQEPL